MTVSTTARRQQFVLDGVEDEFTFTFCALESDPTDIKCIATDGDGVDTELTYTTDYSVTVNDGGIGGTVTLVDPSGVGAGTLTVYRDTTNKQESDYDDYNQFPADTLEEDLDRRTMVSQEQVDNITRTVRLSISTSDTVDAELPSPEAGKVLGWNDAADEIENKTFTPSTDFEKANAADVAAGTNDEKYMTPTMTTIALSDKAIAPATNTDGNVPQWDGTDSKTLKDGLAVGTGATNLVQLDGSAKLPAVDGSQLTSLPTMQAKLGSITITATGSSIAITGVGFQPTVVLFFGGRTTANEGGCLLFGAVTSTAVSSAEGDSKNANFASGVSAAGIVGRSGSSQIYAFTLVSLDADGFTINIADADADNTVYYLALR